MAYVNPYANTMNYEPSTLWEHPEPYKTDWSTFWGQADEDDDDNGDENGTRGDETPVEKGAGSQLKSLWGDVMADMQQNMQSGYDLQQSQNMFDSVFGPGITATNEAQPLSTDVANVGSWQNPNYTGANTQAQNADVTLSALADAPNITATALTDQSTQAYQPSYNQQQQNLIDQSTQAYNQQQQNNIQNVPMQTDFISNIPDWRDMVGVGGLTPNESQAQLDAIGTVTGTGLDTGTPITQEQLGLLSGREWENPEDIEFEEKDWGDFW